MKTDTYIVCVQTGETNTENIVFSYAKYIICILDCPDLIIFVLDIWTSHRKKSTCTIDSINA